MIRLLFYNIISNKCFNQALNEWRFYFYKQWLETTDFIYFWATSGIRLGQRALKFN